MATLSNHTTRSEGATLTATMYNEDHERHVTNAEALNAELATKLSAADLQGVSSVPSGAIMIWSGSIAAIPMGWLLCNGTNGTPDLRNRFIVGAGSTYAVGATGGADAITLSTSQIPAHAHTYSGTTVGAGTHGHTGSAASAGSHTHTTRRVTNAGSGSIGTADSVFANNNDGLTGQGFGLDSAGAHTHSLTINAVGDHAHTFSGTTANAGSGNSHENRPPYYALCYIMKT